MNWIRKRIKREWQILKKRRRDCPGGLVVEFPPSNAVAWVPFLVSELDLASHATWPIKGNFFLKRK